MKRIRLAWRRMSAPFNPGYVVVLILCAATAISFALGFAYQPSGGVPATTPAPPLLYLTFPAGGPRDLSVYSSRPGSTSPGDGSASRPPVGNSTSPAGTTSVPDVDSQPVPDALQLLQQDNLTVGKQEQRANLYVPSMSVITTDPAVGTPEPDGYAVTLLVSAGPPSCQYCPFAAGHMPG